MAVVAPTRRTIVAALVAAALTATVPAAAATGYGDSARPDYQKAVVVHVLKGVFEQGDTRVVDRFVRPDYIQHNPLAPDGAEALKNLGSALHQQFPDAKYNVKRIIAEGDLVLVHSNVVIAPGTLGSAVVDIFRFQDGKIAEHWDTGQGVPPTTVNGNDMFSTVSRPRTEEPGPGWLTARNKKLVTDYVDQLLGRKDLSAIDKYVGTEYHQHNPNIADGVAGVKAGLGGYFAQFPQLVVTTKRVVAEGDLVAVHSHYVNAPGDRGQAVVDLFRVRNGKIVEHWDVIQDVPATSANDNTMF
jgi:predicted SnoaL-like aldol condensation-catalyzing enzyme